MAKFKIVVQRPAAARGKGPTDFSLEMEALGPIGAEIVEVFTDDDSEFAEAARDADAIYVAALRLSGTVIEAAERCKAIAIGSVGFDRIDVATATRRGIPVANCPDTFIEEVADHAMALFLASYRRLPATDRMAREGRWSEARPMLYGFPRLRGLTFGLISYGNVAKAVARRVAPFGLNILAYDPYVAETAMVRDGMEPVTLQELLQRSDFLSLHAPLSDETRKMLSEREFRLMKPTALFINTGRGDTVDEAALIRALQEKWIAGAGLDVLEIEPPDLGNPLLKMDNVIVTPHVASASARMEPERRRRVGRELASMLSGYWPIACVNPTVLGRAGLIRRKPYLVE